MSRATPPADDLFVTHFLVVSDQDRSRDFCQSVFGADVVRDRDPVVLALANTRIVLNVGGGPTDDKPTVRLAPPADPDVSSGFLNLRVRDIAKAYRDWSAKGRHVSHRAEGPRVRNPGLHPRSGRSPHRGRPDHVNGADPGGGAAGSSPTSCRPGNVRWASRMSSAPVAATASCPDHRLSAACNCSGSLTWPRIT
jgi:hypothetical protein